MKFRGPCINGTVKKCALALFIFILMSFNSANATEVLYGANGADGHPSLLMLINPASGDVENVIGAVGYAVQTMAFHPLDNTLYGMTSFSDLSSPNSLIRIDTVTGAGTLIGPAGAEIRGMVFDDAGTLYGYDIMGAFLCTIDNATGLATPVNDLNQGPMVPGALVFGADGRLYLGSGDNTELFELDPATGLGTVVTTLDGGFMSLIKDLTLSSSGTIFGNVDDITMSHLITIDPTTGHVSPLGLIENSGQPVEFMSALAFGPEPPPGPKVLYGANDVNGTSNLMLVDPASGNVINTIGAIGYPVMNLAADPVSGILYGMTADDDLISINTQTGVGTLIGPTNTTIYSMAFNNAGVLYGYDYQGAEAYLSIIDTATGTATPVSANQAPSGTGPFGYGLVFDDDGSLYLSTTADSLLYRLDPATGTGTPAITLDGSAVPVEDLTIDNNGTIYATDIYNLITIDPVSGHVTNIGEFTDSGQPVYFLALAFGPPPAPEPTVLYGANGQDGHPSLLMLINPASGGVESVIGTVGYSVQTMAFHPLDNTLYGMTSFSDLSSPNSLIRIDTVTGAGTLIGPAGAEIRGMVFDDAGTLYGYDIMGAFLCTIDTATGLATPVNDLNQGPMVPGALVFGADGRLYLGSGDNTELFELDPATGLGTVVTTLDGGFMSLIKDLTLSSSGTIFGNVDDITMSHLITIDPTTGHVSPLGLIENSGQPVEFMSALAFGPAPPSGPKVLYGANDFYGTSSNLMLVDPSTGNVIKTIGAIGYPVNTLAADPVSGILYAITFDDDLISINTQTGVGTLIGPTNTTILSMAFNNAGVLYGYDYQGAAAYLSTIDTATGAATPVSADQAPSGPGPFGFGLVFDDDGSLYLSTSADSLFYRLDPATGTGTPVTTLDGTGDVEDLTIDNNGTIYATGPRKSENY